MQKKKHFWDTKFAGFLSYLVGYITSIAMRLILPLIAIWLIIFVGTWIFLRLIGAPFPYPDVMIISMVISVVISFIALIATISDNVSKPAHGLSKCPVCEKEVKGGTKSRFCVGCGVDLDPQCDRCNIPLKAVGSAFCYQCGNPITRPTPTMVLQKPQSEFSHSAKTVTVDMILTNCSVCGSKRNTQDAYCGICGKLFACASIDQTM